MPGSKFIGSKTVVACDHVQCWKVPGNSVLMIAARGLLQVFYSTASFWGILAHSLFTSLMCLCSLCFVISSLFMCRSRRALRRHYDYITKYSVRCCLSGQPEPAG